MPRIEVNFRFAGEYYQEGLEQRRTSYNAPINALKKPDAKPDSIKRAREPLLKLEKQKYPPAMLVMAYVYLEGDWVPKDEARAQQLIDAAAKKNYGPAIFEQGRRKLAGSPENAVAAWKQIRDASLLAVRRRRSFSGTGTQRASVSRRTRSKRGATIACVPPAEQRDVNSASPSRYWRSVAGANTTSSKRTPGQASRPRKDSLPSMQSQIRCSRFPSRTASGSNGFATS